MNLWVYKQSLLKIIHILMRIFLEFSKSKRENRITPLIELKRIIFLLFFTFLLILPSNFGFNNVAESGKGQNVENHFVESQKSNLTFDVLIFRRSDHHNKYFRGSDLSMFWFSTFRPPLSESSLKLLLKLSVFWSLYRF